MYRLRTRISSAPIPSNFVLGESESRLEPCSSNVPGDEASFLFAQTPSTVVIIRQSATTPNSKENKAVPMNHTSSGGGLLFRRKRSVVEQAELSRARSQEMSARYELSDRSDDCLVKNTTLQLPVAGVPELATFMTAKQAAEAFQEHQQQFRQSKPAADTLLTEREHEKQSCLEKTRHFPSSQLFRRLPLQQLKDQHNNTNSSNTVAKAFAKQRSFQKNGVNEGRSFVRKDLALDMELSNSMGMEVVPISPTEVSVAPTEPETPSPKAFRALPSMC